MIRLAMVSASILGLCFLSYVPLEAGKQDTGGVKVDKEKKTITIDAKIAPASCRSTRRPTPSR